MNEKITARKIEGFQPSILNNCICYNENMKEKGYLDICCTNNLEFKFDHFKDIDELMQNIDVWYKEDDIDYTRWFGLNDLHTLKVYITTLQSKIDKVNELLKERKERVENISWVEMEVGDYIQEINEIEFILKDGK